MNSIIKTVLIVAIPVFGLVFITKSCVINNPQPEECEVKEVVISKIYEGSSFDIVFIDKGGDRYYINRGLEQGLTIPDLQSQVLNKKVTLHLPVLLLGTSEHIAQLSVAEDVVFTEFN